MNPTENEERKIWYQLFEGNELGTPKESSVAFDSFQIFLMLGTERTVEKASKKAGKSNGHFSKLATTYKWTLRAEAYDQWKHDLAIKQHEQSLLAEAESHQTEWIKKRSNIRIEEYEVGLKLIATGKKILEKIFENPLNPVVIRRTVKNRYEFIVGKKKDSPKNKNLTGFDESTVFGNALELTNEAVKHIESGFRLCRNSIDLPIGSFGVQNFGSVPTSVDDLLMMNEDDKNSYLKSLDEAETALMMVLEERGEKFELISSADN